MHVLVVEDDTLLCEFIVRCLRDDRYDVDVAHSGDVGLSKAQKSAYDVLILDINLPIMDGLEVCSALRSQGKTTPILFLSSNSSDNDKILGLNHGADDYMTKPFNHRELIARVNALCRRPRTVVPMELEYSDLRIDFKTRRVSRSTDQVKLTPTEFKLLEVLVRNSETVLSREHILQAVWGISPGSGSNRLEVCIRSLRKKLDEPFEKPLIRTEYGIGYKLGENS